MGYGYGVRAEVVRNSCSRNGAQRRKNQHQKAEALAVRISKKLYRKGTIEMGISAKKLLRMAGGDRVVCDDAIRFLQNELRYNVEKRDVKISRFFGRVIRSEKHYLISAYREPGFGWSI